MGDKRVRRTKELKFKVALEAIKGEKRLVEIAAEYHVHLQQITAWKKELLEKGPTLFATQVERDTRRLEEQREDLYRTIGHQQVIIECFNKKLEPVMNQGPGSSTLDLYGNPKTLCE